MQDSPAPSAPVDDAIAAAWAMVERGQAPDLVLAAIEDIASGHAHFPHAQHIRGVCAMRSGQGEKALALIIDAIHRGDPSIRVWMNLTAATASIGFPDHVVSMILDLLRRVSPAQLATFSVQVLRAAGFAGKQPSASNDAAFQRLALPLLSILLDRREMDGALAVEGLLYETYVKPTETEAHFEWCMERIAPLFTAAAHRWRAELPPLAQPSLDSPYKVGFFVHNASMLAHIEVLLTALKGYRMLDEQPFEPTVYCFSGNSREMEQALSHLGVRLVMLADRFPETRVSGWARLLRFRELLPAEGIQELVWVSLVTMLPLAFGLRMAPVQTWLAMKYRNFSHDDIDGYVTGSALTRFGNLGGRRWRMGLLGVDDWYDPALEDKAAAIRADLGSHVVVTMTLARTEKMHDPAYLEAMVDVLKANPRVVFLWAGREESPTVVEAFRAGGVLEQTRFIGWVNTRLYAQVADVFLDTFPFPCGFTLYQAMAAGKPVVIYASPEAAQTGLWAFLKPLVEDGEGTPEERAEVLSFMGDESDPLIAVARTAQDYVRHAERLIGDMKGRAAAGDAAQRFIARYFSDPQVLGESIGRHLVELIEERAAQPPA